MNVRRLTAAALATVVAIGIGISVHAQMKRPYHDGSVWSIQFIRIKPGMENSYMSYLAGDWKKNEEAAKQAGLILSYKVISTEAHGTADFNLMLMVEAKDLASLDANKEKIQAIIEKIVGDDQKQMQGYQQRAEVREIIGSRLAREVVLEPKM
jgi:hypothetical protein